MEQLYNHTGQYLHVYADCIPVKGYSKTAIYDLTRKDVHTLPGGYYELFDVLRQHRIGEILDSLEDISDQENFSQFVSFLLTNELAEFMEDTSNFIPMPIVWDSPSIIDNAIIDFRETLHDYTSAFEQLNELGCQFLQLRFYSCFPLEEIQDVLRATMHKSFNGVDLLVKYDPSLTPKDYIGLFENNPAISSFIIHSSPQNEKVFVNWGYEGEMKEAIEREILYVKQNVTSCEHCGIINKKYILMSDVKGFSENVLFNGCLNKKISIDEKGVIRNCPSMKQAFGHLSDTKLAKVAKDLDFRKYWHINKDSIKECSDCELRYLCTDCRAYTKDPDDLFSKPAKCSYEPYIGEWIN